MRAGFRAVLRTCPWAAYALAEAAFTRPPRIPGPPQERELLLEARHRRLVHAEGDLPTWSWGEGPLVVLLHGWGGRGGQLGAFVAPLVARGFRVVAFDAPGHGRAGGKRASMVHLARALARVAEAEGTPYAVVGHSLGAAAILWAHHRGLRPERVALVAPPHDLEPYFQGFTAGLGFDARQARTLQRRLERSFGVSWTEVRLEPLASRLEIPALLVHDSDDAEAPYEGARALAAALPQGRFLGTGGLGHRRILRDPGVVAAVAEFLADGYRDPDPWRALRAEAAL